MKNVKNHFNNTIYKRKNVPLMKTLLRYAGGKSKAIQQITPFVEKYDKIVIASGLDGDFLQKPFGDICRLISFSDKLTRLKAVCSLSPDYRDAPFSRRIVASDKTELIGTDDSYIAVSRYIYNLPYESLVEKIVEQGEIEKNSQEELSI